MPGFSFIFDALKNLREKESAILQSLDSLIHFSHYKKKILLNENSYFLGYTYYDEYPMTSFISPQYDFYLEGKIYNKDYDVLNKELENLADSIFLSNHETNKIAEWLLSIDGDYVLFIFKRNTQEIAIINDVLGRLPVYYYESSGSYLLSRESRFIVKLLNLNKFDKMAIAQHLLLGYPLGERTLLENVYRLKPGSLIKVSVKEAKLCMTSIYQFNFQTKKYIDKSIRENADKLITLFSDACKNRSKVGDNYKRILSLSGGLDSRSVGACLHNNNITFYGTTIFTLSNDAEKDVRNAKKLANLFGIDWKVFHKSPLKGKDILQLLKIKNGLNYIGMGSILPYFEYIKKSYGSKVIFFTGDGGDKILPDLRHIKKINNLNSLVRNIISSNQKISLNNVSLLTGVSKDHIVDELKSNVLSYPEHDWNQKYVHFIIYERGYKWLFEGEDRNRYYFWSVTPFYAAPLFIYSMNCNDDQKSNYKLYREFLMKMSFEAAIIDNANWNVPITSKKLHLVLLRYNISNRLPINFKQSLKRIILKNKSDENEIDAKHYILEQIKNCSAIEDYFSYQNLSNILNVCSKVELAYLLTLTTYIEEIKCQNSIIDKYKENDFI